METHSFHHGERRLPQILVAARMPHAHLDFDGIDDPSYLETAIDTIPGVVECGLFVGLTHAVEAYREEDDSVVELRITDRRAGPRGSP